MTSLEIILIIFFITLMIGFALFAGISLKEKHHRAAKRAALMAVITILLFISLFFASVIVQKAVLSLLIVSTLSLTVWILWPAKQNYASSPPPEKQVDERTIMFARARLEPGTPRFEAYYREYPEHKPLDDAFRKNPGLLEPSALFYDDLLAATAKGGFILTEALRTAVGGPVAPDKATRPPRQMTRFIKDLAHYYGAQGVGICQLQAHHIYSHIGRGTGEYGAPVSLDHRYAIAISVEMAHDMINTGPRMPAVMESARQYAESSKIAVILAAVIRRLGYPARAHIDGNYRVIAPLVAKDAGLGEIGRMGILMTPRLGPRVRLAVITTDMPLIPSKPTWDPAVIDFCTHCNKCAAVCPSQAIPFGERSRQEDGSLRWKINAERCYTYWTRIGTDCGRCMAVCPFAHADNFLHNMVRFSVAHSGNFRRAAILLDDFFYGKKPLPHSPPDWVQNTQEKP